MNPKSTLPWYGEALFFDLDGTLTDPKPGITACIQYALEKLQKNVPDADELEWCIGPPLQASMAKLVGDENSAQAVALYRERFGDVGWAENRVYEGIPELLGYCQNQGIPMYVATSKPHVFAQRIVDHFDLSQYFQRLYGSELDGTRSDKGELIRYALADSGIREATMIGDRHHDVVGALANGMQAIGVDYGYGSQGELKSAGANQIVSSPNALMKLFSSIRDR